MSTFLLSWLSRQYGALDASVFLREQPGDWLVLESGSAAPARAAEPVAMRLALRRDRTRFTLGSDPASDFVVDDSGVAPAHAVLQPDGRGGWIIQRAAPGSPAQLDGLELGDYPVALGSGARVDLGGARFTFYAGEDLLARLRAT
ncbi:MAG TPA: FHA domain-containing protein [Anaeromyxobacteraceae bacterium]|nr:FHA domain-containing protein [Anaeromyxobacteraceae bacterium]